MTATAVQTEILLCTQCGQPIDPVSYPRHPDHDLTAVELATLERHDIARECRREAVRSAGIRAEENRLKQANRHAQQRAAQRRRSKTR
jgi:hypothetical protein